MSKPLLFWFPAQATWVVLISFLGVGAAACNQQTFLTQATAPSSSVPPAVTKVVPNPVQPSPVAAVSTPKADPYQLAIDRASSAYTMGRSAQSQDDWRLVVNRWQQAIGFMQTVPNSNARHQQAKQKLAEYRQHLVHAQQQANRSTKVTNPDGVIVLPPQARLAPPSPTPTAAPVPFAAAPVAKPVQPNQARTFYAPIIRREGNTPVVRVKFNGNHAFDMIVDTGASGTLITSQMASALGVVPVAQANVDTASQKSVVFPLGYVQSIEVGGALASNVMVAIAGAELDVGLLGHDFFGHYDVTIREKEVEFRERG